MKSKHSISGTHETYEATGRKIRRVYGSENQFTETHAETQRVARRIEGDVELTIDVDAIVRIYGWRALLNKSGKAVEAGGLITVRRLNVHEVSRQETPGRDLVAGESYAHS